jgi:hypothetical protein
MSEIKSWLLARQQADEMAGTSWEEEYQPKMVLCGGCHLISLSEEQAWTLPCPGGPMLCEPCYDRLSQDWEARNCSYE